MKRIAFLLTGIAAIAASAYLVSPQLSRFLGADACLASGGAFDFARLACDFQQDHAYLPFALWPFWSALAGIALGTGLVILGSRRSRSASAGNIRRTR